MHLERLVNHALGGIPAHRAAAQDVGSGGVVQQIFAQRAHRDAVRFSGEGTGHIVTGIHTGIDLVPRLGFGHQALAEESQQAASQADVQAVIHVLHDQQDGHPAGPAGQDLRAQKVERVAQNPADGFEHAHRDGMPIGNERRGQDAHQVGAFRVAHRLDAGDCIGVEDGGDGNDLWRS